MQRRARKQAVPEQVSRRCRGQAVVTVGTDVRAVATGWCSVRTGASFPIFYDPEGRRRRYLWRLGWSLAMTISSLAEVFIISVLFSPALPRLNLRHISEPPAATENRSQAPRQSANRTEQKAARARSGSKESFIKFHKPPVPAAGAGLTASRPLSIGFYVNWDDSSYESLKRHLDQMDQLVPEWLWLQSGDHSLHSEIDQRALDL